MHRLLIFAVLAWPASAWAGPSFFTPTIEQCDGSYAAGSTRQAIPGVRVSLQDSTSPGLKIGTQPSDFFSTARLGARFEDNYRVDVSSCITSGVPAACGAAAACAIATYRYADTTSADAADQGFLGSYFTINDDNVPPNFDWKVRLQQMDGPINFTKNGSFPPGVISSTPTFAARWSGYVIAPVSTNYTFQVTADDGVNLYVNGVNLISSFVDQSATLTSQAVPMTAGQPYQIVLEYYQDGGTANAAIDLKWESAVNAVNGSCSVSTSFADVPKGCMRPQLVGQLGQCVYTGGACGSLGLAGGHNPVGGACPAFGSLPVAPPAGPTPWATSVPGTAPSNASTFSGTNHAWTFNGSSDYIQFDGQGQWYLPTAFTLSAWVKTSNCTPNQSIIAQDDGGTHFWRFGINGCKIDFEDAQENAASPGVPAAETLTIHNDSQWHFLAASRQDGAFWKYYIDGVNVYSGAAISSGILQVDAQNASVPAYVGSLTGASRFFNGQIDELRLYPAILSDDTILMEYAANAYKYSANSGVTFGISTVAYSGSPSNGTTSVVSIGPSTTTATSEFIFVAQSADGLSTTESPVFSVSIDKTAPDTPLIAATPVAANQIQWTFSATRICSDGVSNLFQLFETSTGVHVANTTVGGSTYLETLADATPNVSHARYGKTTDTWGTSALGAVTTSYTLAAAPTGLNSTAVTPTSITLQWSANGNPAYTRYELSMSQNNFSAPADVSTPIAISANFTGNTTTLSGLTAGKPYYFRVRAANGRSTDVFGGAFSNFSFFSTFTTPNASTVAGVARSNTQIDWHWADVTGATSYNLFSSGAPTPFAVVPSPGVPGQDVSYSSTGLLTNTLYSFQMQPVNAGGTGPTSTAANAYTLALPPLAVNPVGVTTNSASFQWDAGAAPPLADPSYTFYELSIATDPLFAVVVATQTTQQLTMTLGGLLPASTYYTRVRAYSGGQSTTTFTLAGSTVTNPSFGVSVSSAPSSVYVPPSGVVGLWQFDDGTSTAAKDSSSFGNAGLFTCLTAGCVSTPTLTSGPPNLNTAVSLTGQTSSLVLIADPGIYNFTDALTVGAWVNPATTALPNGAGIVAKGVQGAEAFSLDVFGSRYRFLVKPGLSITAPSAVDAGHWHRVVGVYDGVNASLYIDGALVAGPTALGGPRLNPLCNGVNCPVGIGNRTSATGAYDLGFNGAVDSVLLVHRALASPEVLSDYQGAFASTMTLPNTRVQLVLPPNAFGAPAQIFFSNDPIGHPIRIDALTMTEGLLNEPTGQALIGGSLVEVVPTVGGIPYTMPLGSSATISLPYFDSTSPGIVDGTNPPVSVNTLTVYTLDPTIIKWNALATTVDTADHLVRATTPHFSVFALFGATTLGSSLDQVRVYPKPWMIGSKGRFDAQVLTFDTLPAQGTIKIFNLAGERVVELPFTSVNAGKVQWPGTNSSGLTVASGVYFAYIKNSGNNATSVVKFAIER